MLEKGENTFQFHDDRALKGEARLAVQGWYEGRNPNQLGSRNNKPKGPTYVLFPFQRTNETPERPGQVGVRFRLIMTLAPHAEADSTLATLCVDGARQALWAWIMFGGVGSRTRRGCGSLLCQADGELANRDGKETARIMAKELRPPEHGTIGWITRNAATYVKSGGNLIGPSLQGAVFRISNAKTHINAWSIAVQPYSDFRQGRRVGRNFGSTLRPGQSRWPEPGAVRNLFNLDATHQGNTSDQEAHPYFKGTNANGGDFPRADLGLPLLFQNMDGLSGAAELSRSAKGAARFASPLIVKALAVTNERSIPLALMMNTPHLWELQQTTQLVLKHPDKKLVERNPAKYAPKIKPEPMNVPTIHWPTKSPSTPDALFDKPKGVDDSTVSIRQAFFAYMDLPHDPSDPLAADKPVWKSGTLKSATATETNDRH
jgi:CRISPR-associated protein Cmr1